MNRFLKTNLQWLSLLGLALMLILLTFLFRPNSPQFQLNADNSMKLILDPAGTIRPQDLANRQLVDIRSEELYAMGHPTNAISMPLRKLLDKASVQRFNELLHEGKEVVLCGSNELQATAPWLLLRQLGYRNILLLEGGIGQNGMLLETDQAASEKSVIDKSLLSSKPETGQAPESKSEVKKAEVVLPVRKAASAGGGC